MKIQYSVMAACISVILMACGGGGGGSSTSSPTSPPTTPTTPTTTIGHNPYTNASPPGSLTSTLSGIVYSNRTTGATVRAYQVNTDGTNGTLIGTSGVTGADGSFSIALTTQPTGYIRLISTGGTYTSEADGTTQAAGTLELVTPYVTTSFNTFVITPITHIAAHVFAFKASQGLTLDTSYITGIGYALELGGEDAPLRADANFGLDILDTVPGSANDLLNAYQDVLTAIEWFGVQNDLPSTTSIRVIASNAEADYPIPSLVDGSNNQINVGTWANGTFNDGVSGLTLTQMMNTLSVAVDLQYSLSQSFYAYAACQNASAAPAYFARFPSQTTNGDTNDPIYCLGLSENISALKAKITTNNRTKYQI